MFKNQRPGITWIKNFMKRNHLTHKKAEMISSARKANTSNPFNDSTTLIRLLGPHPYASPPAFHWVSNGWKLGAATSTPVSNKTFEDLFLDKVKGPVNKTKPKRQKLDL